MINKFISGLAPNEKKVLTVAALCVLLALFDRLLIGPSVSRLKDIDETIAKQETVIKQNMRFLTYRERIVKEAGTFKDFYARDVRSEEEIIAEFLKKIELMASSAQVELSKMTPAGQEAQKDYVKYLITLDCSGKLEDIAAFIYAVNNAKSLLKVEKMSMLGNSRDAAKVLANMTISRMIVGADPSTDAQSLIKAKEAEAAPPAAPVEEKK